MPQQTKIFRLFVSSTFTDMVEERRMLQRKVFPKLGKFCEENGAKFQAVDLRWGVNEGSQLNQETLEICLNEIARCQKISPKPNFLILLGDRYGWQPVPAKIPKNEMEGIHSVCGDCSNLLLKWYKLDTNANPAEYVLQPRAKEYIDYAIWEKDEKNLQLILRDSVNKLSLSPEQRIKYFSSATHQEIVSGALNPANVKERPEDHVFALIRETEGLPEGAGARGFIDLINDQPDQYCKDQLKQLKSSLKEKLGEHCMTYRAKWEEGKTSMNDPEGFEKTIYDFLEDIIRGQIKTVIGPDEISHEMSLHSEFKNRLTEHFGGRESILNTIKTYLNNASEKRVMALIGESGSGKSSVLAQAIHETEAVNGNAIIVYRFIGTTSHSSNIISLLQGITCQIAREFNTTLEKLAGEGKEKTLNDLNGLTEIFKKCLSLGNHERPIIVFLDALDQLSDSVNGRSLYWLPCYLPDHVRVIVSSLPGLKDELNSQYIEILPVLPLEEASQILERWLASIHRDLSPAQKEEVLKKFSYSNLPLYLKLAFERAKKWNSYTSDVVLKEDVKGMINSFIDLLERDHVKDFVQDVICYLLSGRYMGLAENEILEILAFDEDHWQKFLERTHPDHRQELIDQKEEFKKSNGAMKIPIIVWSRLYLDLEPFLTERDADGVPIITFFHRQFNEVLQERYGLVEVEKGS